MQAFRLSDEARAAVNAAVDAATKAPAMTHAEEVRALMGKGMKVCIAQGHAVWAFVPRAIALSLGVPYCAALPAALDLADYMALGGDVVTIH
jgi:hypothetical protein